MSRIGNSRRGRNRGFTLAEILIVLAIIIMIYGFFSPAYSNLVLNKKFDRTVQILVDDLKTLRSQAILKGNVETLKLDKNGTSYSTGEINRVLADDTRIRIIAPANQVISYYPNGQNNHYNIAVLSGRREAYIQPSWLTGHIEISQKVSP